MESQFLLLGSGLSGALLPRARRSLTTFWGGDSLAIEKQAFAHHVGEAADEHDAPESDRDSQHFIDAFLFDFLFENPLPRCKAAF